MDDSMRYAPGIIVGASDCLLARSRREKELVLHRSIFRMVMVSANIPGLPRKMAVLYWKSGIVGETSDNPL
jgi:hypothetical protein